MTRKERFMAALRLQQPDRVPMFDFLFQQPMYEHLIGRRAVVTFWHPITRCTTAFPLRTFWPCGTRG
jgi:hypothetical protein